MSSSNHGWWLVLALAGAHAAANSADSAGRPIYRCHSGGATTFSDRPCDAAAEIYQSATPVNSYEAPKSVSPARGGTAARPRVDTRFDRESASRAKLQEKCRRIQQSLRDLRSKMRAGYTAREGERLRERQTTLEEQRRAAKCR